MEKPKSLVVFGEVVYNAEEIYQYDKRFFVGCARSRLIVENKNIPETMYLFAYEKDGVWVKSTATYKRAKLFLREDYVLQNIPKMMNITETSTTENSKSSYKYEEAPPILELEDHEKFKDENGEPIEIEVRGTRKHNDCYFRVKDVSEGFDMPSLRTTLTHNTDNNYEEGLHYKIFITPQVRFPHNDINKKSNKKMLYLTYLGVLRVLFCSRTKGNAEKFQMWATEKLFTIQMGEEEDRDNLAAELIGVNAKTIKNVFRHNVAKTPCIYLIFIGSADELLCREKYTSDHYLCKFGCTDNLPRRVSEHQRTFKREFGKNIKLLLFSIIDVKFIDVAETNIKQYFGVNRVEHKNIKGENSKELVVFHKDDMDKIKEHYKMIQTTYIGQHAGLKEENVELQKEIIGYIHQLELKDKELEIKDKDMKVLQESERHKRELLEEKYKNELKDKDLLLRDKDIELLRMKVQFLEK